MPQPEKRSARRRRDPRSRARPAYGTPQKRRWPAFDATTSHGRLSRSSASAYVPSRSSQKSSLMRWRSEAAAAVTVALHPVHGGARVRPELAHELQVARHPCVGAEQHAEERRCVEAAVVASEGHLAGRRHLAVAGLVDDLAGLLVALGVHLAPLQGGERTQDAA